MIFFFTSPLMFQSGLGVKAPSFSFSSYTAEGDMGKSERSDADS